MLAVITLGLLGASSRPLGRAVPSRILLVVAGAAVVVAAFFLVETLETWEAIEVESRTGASHMGGSVVAAALAGLFCVVAGAAGVPLIPAATAGSQLDS